MELTMDCFLHILGKRHKIIKNGEYNLDFSISGIQILVREPDREDVLYLCVGPGMNDSRNILYIVSDAQQVPRKGCCLLCGEDPFRAVNACFQVCQEYFLWREKCRELALVEHDLAGLLQAGAEYLHAEMCVIDRDYRNDGLIKLPHSHMPEFIDTPADMDVEEVENLYTLNPRFDETFQTDGLVYYPYFVVANGRLYYYNLRYERLYLGRLLYSVPEETDSPGFRHLAEGFGVLVEKCYEFHYLRKNKGMPRHSVYDLWKQLLEGKPIDREEADRRLAAMGWEPSDRYRILHLLPNGYVRSQETLKFYAVQLEQTFSACIAVQKGDGVFLLHNLDRECNANFRQELADFLRENLFVSGISNSFRDFFDSERYSAQAKEALELGIRINPSLWRHEFRDYQKEYILQQCLSRYAARDLCPAELEKLLLHDGENPEVELAKTLETYYNCKFNAAEAAKQLYIHRTTFFYRLNKIRQIAEIDFDDPMQRLQILLYFALAREEQRREGKGEQ